MIEVCAVCFHPTSFHSAEGCRHWIPEKFSKDKVSEHYGWTSVCECEVPYGVDGEEALVNAEAERALAAYGKVRA